MKRALITGITGQDGSYLAELLLQKGYRVYGLVRRTASACPFSRLSNVLNQVELVDADLLDEGSLIRAVELAQPDEVYNLAAQSFVAASFREPVATAQITGIGTLKLLEAVRIVTPKARVYQASTSELFGLAPAPQNELTTFHPRSPYAVAKLFAHWTCRNYRESYDMHVSTGILFNHESPRRGAEFVTRKISLGVARIAAGVQSGLRLGNMAARRDWGWAPEYVEAMWGMVQLERGDDFVLGTGVTHSVEEFCALAFSQVGLDWHDYVQADESQLRPADVYELRADAGKAQRVLGWEPQVTFPEVVKRMVEADRVRVREETNRI